MRLLVCVLVLGTIACTRDPSTMESRNGTHESGSAVGAGATNVASTGGAQSARKIIGKATMREDGTLVLDLFIPATAQLVYPPSHQDYALVLVHLGGMKPGEEKPVPEWP